MCASSDINILLLLRSRSLSSDNAVTELPRPLLKIPSIPAAVVVVVVGEDRGGELSEHKWSSDSGGELLRVVWYAKKPVPLWKPLPLPVPVKGWGWWWLTATCGCDVFRRWISHSKCFSPFLKNSFANSHLSGTIFLKP
ncbi:hypothetical protein Hanom_Chr02g00115291 [Helianthus anomalus]